MDLLKQEIALVDDCISTFGTEGAAAPCIQKVQEGGYKSYTNREAEEEMDKDAQFLKANGGEEGEAGEEGAEGEAGEEGGEREGEVESPEEAGEEAAEKASTSQLRAKPAQAIRRSRKSQAAAGERAWKKFLRQTDKMNNIATQDNVIAQW
jgi:hypothetical protein